LVGRRLYLLKTTQTVPLSIHKNDMAGATSLAHSVNYGIRAKLPEMKKTPRIQESFYLGLLYYRLGGSDGDQPLTGIKLTVVFLLR
jgi:hypothetical protein